MLDDRDGDDDDDGAACRIVIPNDLLLLLLLVVNIADLTDGETKDWQDGGRTKRKIAPTVVVRKMEENGTILTFILGGE